MVDINELSFSQKAEIADYIKRDNLTIVNHKLKPAEVKDSFYTRYGKRCIDIVFSLLALTVTAPINLVLAVITFFDVGCPVLFHQKRIGIEGRKFTIYKFRNMTNETDANGELLPPSQRVTKWGKIARKTSLDELLNFVSVLKGDMSIIGPRPLLDYYFERLSDRHKTIYKVRPGLECPAPQHVDHCLSWQERLDNYVWYAENCSFMLDVRLLFRMVAIALDRRSTSSRSQAKTGGLMGYDTDGNVIYTKAVPDRFVDEFLTTHGYKSIDEAVADRYSERNCA